jgi:hypothetical protein
VLAFAAAAQAVGVQPTIGQAALLAAGSNLATAIPAAPGYVGTFELAAVTIAASVGIPAESALAFAVLIHATTLVLTSVGGVVAYFFGPRGRVARKAGEPAPASVSAPDPTSRLAPASRPSAAGTSAAPVSASSAARFTPASRPAPATAQPAAADTLDARPPSQPAAEPER